MRNEDFKHGEFAVMTQLWAIYKLHYKLRTETELRRTEEELRTAAAKLHGQGCPLAAPFAMMLTEDIRRQYKENAGLDPNGSRAVTLSKLCDWFLCWDGNLPDFNSEADEWDDLIDGAEDVYSAADGDEFMCRLVLACESDLEERSRKKSVSRTSAS